MCACVCFLFSEFRQWHMWLMAHFVSVQFLFHIFPTWRKQKWSCFSPHYLFCGECTIRLWWFVGFNRSQKNLDIMFWNSSFSASFSIVTRCKEWKGFSTAKPIQNLPCHWEFLEFWKICFCSLVMQTIWFIYFTMIYLNIIKNTIFIGKIMIISF